MLFAIQWPHGPVLEFLVLFAVILLGPTVVSRFGVPGLRVEDLPQVAAEPRRQQGAAAVHLGAETRLAAVGLGRHAGVLGPLTGEDDRDAHS